MTNRSTFSFIAIIIACTGLLFTNGCKELGPLIDFTDNTGLIDTTYIDNNLPPVAYKKILFEEYTGVQCSNCPKGHQTTEDILADHGDSIIAVAIHNDNPLANPWDNAKFPDQVLFRVAEGITISQKLGGSAAIPSATINRTLFAGEPREAVFRPFWVGYVNQALGGPSPLNIDLSGQYNDATRELLVTVKLHFTQDVDSTCNLSIMISESGIVSPQLLVDLSIDTFYVHDHIFRGMMTPAFGTLTNQTTELGRVVIKQFKTTLPDDWDEDNCHIIAAVHFIGGSNEVIQSEQIDVK